MHPQTTGLLIAGPEAAAPPLDDEAATLRDDVRCILLECHRDRALQAVLHSAATTDAIHQLADAVARRLAPRIGGRYVPKGQYRDGWQMRAQRDAAVWKAFNGRNRLEVMREFRISKALFYNIISRKPRGGP